MTLLGGSEGKLLTNIDGDGGDDDLYLQLSATRSKAALRVRMLGDDGNDHLAASIFTDEFFDDLRALADGGDGRNTCRVSPNVTVVNCGTAIS